ncbi:MAG: kinase [Candidatus Binatia bacterium]|nr:kinase [Candidatus Binatia bacterium]
MILTATPYRVSFFGGGTDYPEWFREHGGCVLGMAINHYCYVALKPLPPFYPDIKYRIVYAKVEDRKTAAEIEHPAVRGCLQYMDLPDDLEISHMGDLPARAGLGASSSFVVGLLHALQLHGSHSWIESRLLADAAIHVERNVIGEAVGCQDQIFAAMGGLNFIEFHAGEAESWRCTTESLSGSRIRELEASLVLAYTGTMRSAHVMAAKQIEAMPDKEPYLTALKELAVEARLLLHDEKHSLTSFGTMLDQAWRCKQQLCAGITSTDIDDLYWRGISLGALGGKLLGAGGGGFVLFFVPPVEREVFIHRIGVPCVTFGLSQRGTHQISMPTRRIA